MAKGGQFERLICDQLSKWWVGNEDESVFWRASQSGGRATVRRRKGKTTKNQDGDITFTDIIGEPLIRLFVIEVKRGYQSHTLAELFDHNGCTKPGDFEQWLNKAQMQAEESGRPYWMLIQRRNSKLAMVYFSAAFYDRCRDTNLTFKGPMPKPFATFVGYARKQGKAKVRGSKIKLCAMRLDTFLEIVQPKHIRRIAKHFRKVKR